MSRRIGILYAAMVLLFAGCASVNRTQTPSATASSMLDAQEKWLRGLKRGLSVQDVALPVAPNSRYSLEIFDNGKHYQYLKGMYPGTGMLYGLYFEDGQLTALLLDQDVTDFFRCEFAYRHNSDRWQLAGMQPVDGWVKTHDLLGRDFDARVDFNNTETMDASDVIEAATYLPLAAMAAPVYGAYLLAGGGARDEREARQLTEALAELQPGSATEDDLQRLLGIPELRSQWESGEMWYYNNSTVLFGTADGAVIWEESGRIETPRNASTKNGNEDCGDM